MTADLDDLVWREHDAQERRAASLDGQAGLVLAFASVLVASSPEAVSLVALVLARVIAVTAAAVALRALTRLPGLRIDLNVIRFSDSPRQSFVDLVAAAHRAGNPVVQQKERRVRASIRLLAASLATIAVGAAVQAAADLGR